MNRTIHQRLDKLEAAMRPARETLVPVFVVDDEDPQPQIDALIRAGRATARNVLVFRTIYETREGARR